jgi:hypothetical protein
VNNFSTKERLEGHGAGAAQTKLGPNSESGSSGSRLATDTAFTNRRLLVFPDIIAFAIYHYARRKSDLAEGQAET